MMDQKDVGDVIPLSLPSATVLYRALEALLGMALRHSSHKSFGTPLSWIGAADCRTRFSSRSFRTAPAHRTLAVSSGTKRAMSAP
jgi:hypothetical protein